jgi:uncharacterized protein (TIGR00730 family)
MRSIAVFCGSSPGSRPAYAAAAIEVGAYLAERGIDLVYGGGNCGLMGLLAEAALRARGRVTGVIPRPLVEREVAHHGVTSLEIVETMHERKARMAELADAFLVLPGGFGTFDEFCEILTWRQLGFHQKPLGLLNVEEYWDPMLAMFRHACQEGFLRRAHLDLVHCDADLDALLSEMRQDPGGPAVAKWI